MGLADNSIDEFDESVGPFAVDDDEQLELDICDCALCLNPDDDDFGLFSGLDEDEAEETW